MQFRKERDSLGEINVPTDAYFGASTTRSLHNFQISSKEWRPEIISAIAQLKKACAQANADLNLLEKKKANAIVKACDEIIGGKLHDQFPLDIFQSGSGTSTNMNVNEVIGHRATELMGGKKGSKLVHPNDDVNKGQSTNNVIPSGIRVAAITKFSTTVKKISLLEKSLLKKAKQFDHILKSSRTHLQDAVPIRLGQEFNAYATATSKHIKRLNQSKEFLLNLGIGGNAVGTGLNTKPAFRKTIIKHLNKNTKLNFKVTADGIESTQFQTDLAGFFSSLKLLAIDMNKIANDLRLLSSGPKTGLNEINLPAVEPGSSIMPGKINPSIPEAVNMACHYVMGNDTTIMLSTTSGNLDKNTHIPIIGHLLIESMEIMGNTAKTLAEKCIDGITANEDVCRSYVEHSPALATALNPYIGYDKVAAIVKESLKTGKTIQQLVVEKKHLTKKQVDKILDPKNLTQPNL